MSRVQVLCDVAGTSGPCPGELGLGITWGSSSLPSYPPTGPCKSGSLCSPAVIPKGGGQSFPRGPDWGEWLTRTTMKAKGSSSAGTSNTETRDSHGKTRAELKDHRRCERQSFKTSVA